MKGVIDIIFYQQILTKFESSVKMVAIAPMSVWLCFPLWDSIVLNRCGVAVALSILQAMREASQQDEVSNSLHLLYLTVPTVGGQVGRIRFISIVRTLRLIGTTLLMVVLYLNFAAYGNDDDDDTPTSGKLVGQWILVYEEGYEKNPAYPEYDEEWSRVPEGECYDYGRLTFRADGTLTEYELGNSIISSGKWTLSNGLLSLRHGSDTDVYDLKVIKLTSTKLILEYYEGETDGDRGYSKVTYQEK